MRFYVKAAIFWVVVAGLGDLVDAMVGHGAQPAAPVMRISQGWRR